MCTLYVFLCVFMWVSVCVCVTVCEPMCMCVCVCVCFCISKGKFNVNFIIFQGMGKRTYRKIMGKCFFFCSFYFCAIVLKSVRESKSASFFLKTGHVCLSFKASRCNLPTSIVWTKEKWACDVEKILNYLRNVILICKIKHE